MSISLQLYCGKFSELLNSIRNIIIVNICYVDSPSPLSYVAQEVGDETEYFKRGRHQSFSLEEAKTENVRF